MGEGINSSSTDASIQNNPDKSSRFEEMIMVRQHTVRSNSFFMTDSLSTGQIDSWPE